MIKHLVIGIALAAAIGFIATPQAVAQTTDTCAHTGTIQSLSECVQQASMQGLITNQGITQSLLAKLDAAQAAVDRNQPAVAVNLLEAFIDEVQAQAGHHIIAEHAQHLVEHAQLVIQALTTP